MNRWVQHRFIKRHSKSKEDRVRDLIRRKSTRLKDSRTWIQRKDFFMPEQQKLSGCCILSKGERFHRRSPSSLVTKVTENRNLHVTARRITLPRKFSRQDEEIQKIHNGIQKQLLQPGKKKRAVMQWEEHTDWRKPGNIYQTKKHFASTFNKDDYVKDGSRRKMSNRKKIMGNYCSGEKHTISFRVQVGHVYGDEGERSKKFYCSTQNILEYLH